MNDLADAVSAPSGIIGWIGPQGGAHASRDIHLRVLPSASALG